MIPIIRHPDCASSRVIRRVGVENGRDLGGLPIRTGGRTAFRRIYRSASLDQLGGLSREGLFSSLNVGLVIDFRSPEECSGASLLAGSVPTRSLPMLGNGQVGREAFPSGDAARLSALYLANVERGAGVCVEAMNLVADAWRGGHAALVHCAAGRDRTGAWVALILDALGVKRAAIEVDYCMSNCDARVVEHRLASNPLYARVSPGANVCVGATIRLFLDRIADAYVSSQGFLESYGLRDDVWQDFRRYLIAYRRAD